MGSGTKSGRPARRMGTRLGDKAWGPFFIAASPDLVGKFCFGHRHVFLILSCRRKILPSPRLPSRLLLANPSPPSSSSGIAQPQPPGSDYSQPCPAALRGVIEVPRSPPAPALRQPGTGGGVCVCVCHYTPKSRVPISCPALHPKTGVKVGALHRYPSSPLIPDVVLCLRSSELWTDEQTDGWTAAGRGGGCLPFQKLSGAQLQLTLPPNNALSHLPFPKAPLGPP